MSSHPLVGQYMCVLLVSVLGFGKGISLAKVVFCYYSIAWPLGPHAVINYYYYVLLLVRSDHGTGKTFRVWCLSPPDLSYSKSTGTEL